MNKELEDLYNSRCVSLDEAVSHIKSGDRIVVSHATGEPSEILHAMCEHKDDYRNVEIVHMVAMGKAEYCRPGMEEHFIHNSLFVGATSRECINSGRGLFTPVNMSDVPALWDTTLPVDVCLLTVTPPDEDGWCSLGIACDFTKHAAENARTVIAEVNDQYPWVNGEQNKIHIKDIDYMVRTSHEPIILPPAKITDVERNIGRNCASLSNDGDCLQLGIGSIPDAVLAELGDKKDLGIHSEMISSGVVALMKKGVINGKKKNFHNGKIVATFLMGDSEYYKFLDHNPDIELYTCDYVNDPFVIAKNDNLVSINSCVQIDFTGQVCSESVGPMQISGSGGQLDFVLGANRSKGGKSVFAIPSTARHGKVSRIVPQLDPGAIVTTPRNLVNYVVTEYGVAQLKGRTTQDRARALIKIAHPDFRPELIQKFEETFKCSF